MTAVLGTSLEEFLQLTYIDESPAWEYINAKVVQKQDDVLLDGSAANWDRMEWES